MDPQVKLENYEWAELEDQFAKRMEAFRAEEDGIWDEWKAWGEIFKAWASTISVHDEERAAKRYSLPPTQMRVSASCDTFANTDVSLRTRMAYTQGSEESLEAKRQHCESRQFRTLRPGLLLMCPPQISRSFRPSKVRSSCWAAVTLRTTSFEIWISHCLALVDHYWMIDSLSREDNSMSKCFSC